MPSKADANSKISSNNLLKEIENDFKGFFSELSESKMNKIQLIKIIWPLKARKWKEKYLDSFFKYAWMAIIILLFILLAFYVDFITWNVAAVGRLSLKKLHSIWHWDEMYKAKCLIGKSKNVNDYAKGDYVEKNVLTYNDCAVCENIDKITRISNTTYSYLHDKFLLRGHPTIISDSHETWNESENFASYLLSLPGLTYSDPCELQTNLMLFKSSNLKTLLQLTADNIESDSDHWFIHFRNCDFEAVKASRAFIPKLYFYSPHLEPPYTSWLLMSQNYIHDRPKELSLLNMVIIEQLLGTLQITLEAKDLCLDVCGSHFIQINAGESLVFMSKLWKFKYVPSDNSLSVTVVTETHLM
uniref:CSON006020 protein n=1 Tax=Culicoides sonorensis TaxID=179676 RepID=A0A336K1B6_CULSO